jgi:hypothetical protein
LLAQVFSVGADFGPVLQVMTPIDLEQEQVVFGSSEQTSYEHVSLHDLTPEQITAIINSGDFAQLHRRTKEVGLVFMTFTQYFERFSPFVSAMRDKIKAARGSHRKTEVEPHVWMSWSEYCKVYFGVSSRWIEQLLADQHKQHEPEPEAGNAEVEEGLGDPDVRQTETKKPSKKDAIIAALEKDNARLKEEMAELKSDITRLQCDKTLAAAEAKHEAQTESEADPEFDGFSFVIDYFGAIIQPEYFASEIDRLIRHFNMQAHIKTVLVEAPAATEGL